jgi:hypothetical protein
VSTLRKYPYFDVLVGLAWSNDPDSDASSSVATGRTTHAKQVKGYDPDRQRYPGHPGWGVVGGATTSPHKNVLLISF